MHTNFLLCTFLVKADKIYKNFYRHLQYNLQILENPSEGNAKTLNKVLKKVYSPNQKMKKTEGGFGKTTCVTGTFSNFFFIRT